MEIRWDTDRMTELAASLEQRADELLAWRAAVIGSAARGGRPDIRVRDLVLSALWARAGCAELRMRRDRLLAAESELLWTVGAPVVAERWRPPRRSRSIREISDELDAAFSQLAAQSGGAATRRTELRIAELAYELAVAERNRNLLDGAAEPAAPSALADLIDCLGYQITKARPRPVDWNQVAAAVAAIRSRLDESWFGDVGRGDLQAIHAIIDELAGPDLDAVIGRLSADELYRWFHELDGVRGGNLDETEEAALFTSVAQRASAPTLFRLAGAEAGSRFMEIAAAVRKAAPAEVRLEFIEICAAVADEDTMLAALAGLAALDARHRHIAVSTLQLSGSLDGLLTRTAEFVARQTVERDDPVLIEFFEGLGTALATTATTFADLTVAGLFDRDRFRHAWSDVGELTGMAFTDPAQFAAIVLDLETLRRNPARWTGSMAATALTAAAGRLALAGKLGNATGAAASWIERAAGRTIVGSRYLQLTAGQLYRGLNLLGLALDAAAVREMVEELAAIEGHMTELEELLPVR